MADDRRTDAHARMVDAFAILEHHLSQDQLALERHRELEAMAEKHGAVGALLGLLSVADICLRHVFVDTGEVVRASRTRRGRVAPLTRGELADLQLDFIHVYQAALDEEMVLDDFGQLLDSDAFDRWRLADDADA